MSTFPVITRTQETAYSFKIGDQTHSGFKRGNLFHGFREYTRERSQKTEVIVVCEDHPTEWINQLFGVEPGGSDVVMVTASPQFHPPKEEPNAKH